MDAPLTPKQAERVRQLAREHRRVAEIAREVGAAETIVKAFIIANRL